jgi:hypothetical protein
MVSEPDENELEKLIEEAMEERSRRIPSPYPEKGTKATIKLSQSQLVRLHENTEALNAVNETERKLVQSLQSHRKTSLISSIAMIILSGAILFTAIIQILVQVGAI